VVVLGVLVLRVGGHQGVAVVGRLDSSSICIGRLLLLIPVGNARGSREIIKLAPLGGGLGGPKFTAGPKGKIPG
jgi:hypothetical protein